MNPLVSINENKATTTSLLIAVSFDKQHKDVLRAISKVECSEEFAERNFAPGSYYDANKQLRPVFNITRDGFVWLAMGFTGKKAAEFKEKFITAFNQMEQALIEGQGERRQIDINHRRLSNAPEGLDIRYNLDLAKVIANPTPKRLAILTRLTGIDFEDLVELPDENLLTDEQILLREAIRFFLSEKCESKEGTMTNSTVLYSAFSQWWMQRHPLQPVPSHRLFGTNFQAHGIKRQKKNGGLYYYLNIRLNSET